MDIQPLLQPIIITCKINNDAEGYFNGLRQKYFPRDKNLLDAHLTLFHHIQLHKEIVYNTVRQIASGIKTFEMMAARIAFTGRGVAIVIQSHELIELHKTLQQDFKAVLTPQDKQRLWPHITIQNKTAVGEAKVLATALQKNFQPFTVTALGLQLFYYLNGPWEFIAEANFCKEDLV